jgi:predicted ATPase
VLLDSLRDASRATQVLITSHSPDLLNDKNISPDSILAVFARNGETIIGPLNSIGRQALNDHLYTVGELLRLNQLEPELEQPALLVATSGV